MPEDNIIINQHYIYFPPFPDRNPYLTFSSSDDFTLATYNSAKNWDGTLYCSTDAESWSTWDGTTTLSSLNGKLFIRGSNNSKITYVYSQSWWVLTPDSNNTISCSGNIENLLDWETVEAGNHPIMADWCFYNLFLNCTALTKAPDLPATTLSVRCYASMFSGCTGLTTAPKLPATTMADYCYEGMFHNNSALHNPPALPATTLATGCYSGMFMNCTSLGVPPDLPATTLAKECYQDMFYGCAVLAYMPLLPANLETTIVWPNYCYQRMFQGCTEMLILTPMQNLNATSVSHGTKCFEGMFKNCTNVKVLQISEPLGEYQNYLITTYSSGNSWANEMFAGTGGATTTINNFNSRIYTSNQLGW